VYFRLQSTVGGDVNRAGFLASGARGGALAAASAVTGGLLASHSVAMWFPPGIDCAAASDVLDAYLG
jgi:hypothetical protein